MSIENVLTVAVAVVLLVTAVLLRFVAIGLFRLGRVMVGAQDTPRHARLDAALPAVSLRERTARFAEGVSALSIYVAATIASLLRPVVDGLRIALRASWYGLVAAYAWLAPRAEEAFENLNFASEAPIPVLAQRSHYRPWKGVV